MTEGDELALRALLQTTHSSLLHTRDPSDWKQILKNLVLPALLHVEQLALRTRAGEADLLLGLSSPSWKSSSQQSYGTGSCFVAASWYKQNITL